eukprot:6463698-Amphidinium_carterae.1
MQHSSHSTLADDVAAQLASASHSATPSCAHQHAIPNNFKTTTFQSNLIATPYHLSCTCQQSKLAWSWCKVSKSGPKSPKKVSGNDIMEGSVGTLPASCSKRTSLWHCISCSVNTRFTCLNQFDGFTCLPPRDKFWDLFGAYYHACSTASAALQESINVKPRLFLLADDGFLRAGTSDRLDVGKQVCIRLTVSTFQFTSGVWRRVAIKPKSL